MNNQELLCSTYTSMLRFAGLRVTEDGFVKHGGNLEGKNWKPFTMKGLSLVIPTEGQLKQSDWSNRIAFHPLLENTALLESAILTRYRKLAFHQLNTSIGAMMGVLLSIAASESDFAKLTPTQSEFLTLVTGADETSCKNFSAVYDGIKDSQKGRFYFHVFLSRKGVQDGVTYNRAARVEFPFYEELKNLPNVTEKGKQFKINGVSIRKKDRELWMALYEYILPQLQNTKGDCQFVFGSNSRLAPACTALMHALGSVASPVNETILTFKNFVPVELLHPVEESITGMDLEWMTSGKFDNIDDWASMIRSVPVLTGNDVSEDQLGDSIEARKLQGAAPAQPAAPAPAAPAAAPAQPVAPPRTAPAYNPPAPSYNPPVPGYGQAPRGYPGQAPQPGQGSVDAAGVVRRPDGSVDAVATAILATRGSQLPPTQVQATGYNRFVPPGAGGGYQNGYAPPARAAYQPPGRGYNPPGYGQNNGYYS